LLHAERSIAAPVGFNGMLTAIAEDGVRGAATFDAAPVFDAAKLAAAHGAILSTCHRMQADALTIEARAQYRLANEYDAAQERGDVKANGAARVISLFPTRIVKSPPSPTSA
jgi:hypothetical protein